MADQNAKIDGNHRKTLLGVTDDASAEIRRIQVDANGRVLVSATGGGGRVDTVVSGTGITVDPTDEDNPIVNLSAGSIASLALADSASQATGVENNADVTSTVNVASAGALMDSEVTNLAQVKAFDTTDYATSAQGATADSALQSIADDSITLAKMAGGTDGNLITYDASGNPAYVDTGLATQVLTSNGAGTAPTFQAGGGGGGGFDPTTTFRIFDDFSGGLTTSGNIGDLGWTLGETGSGDVLPRFPNDSFGAIGIYTGTTSGSVVCINLGKGFTTTYQGTTTFPRDQATHITFRAYTTTANTRFWAGLLRATSADNSNPDQYIAFELDTTVNANWRGACKNGAGTTYTSTTVAPSLTFKKFEIIINATSTSVEFLIDDVTLGSLTTNIPGDNLLGPAIKGRYDANDKEMVLDYYQLVVSGITR